MSSSRLHNRHRCGPSDARLRKAAAVKAATAWALLGLLGLLALGTSCGDPVQRTSPVALPLVYKNGLLYGFGQISPLQDERCGDPMTINPLDEPPASRLMLIDTAVPLTSFAGRAGSSPQVYPHGQVALFAPGGSNTMPGPMRFLRCDTRVLRSDQAAEQFQLGWDAARLPDIGGVIGGDQLLEYALTLRFTPAMQTPDSAVLELTRSDIATSCQIDDAVLPFRLLGGQLQVQVNENVITYPASRVTVPVCVEPLADPMASGPDQTALTACIDPARIPGERTAVAARLSEELAKPGSQQSESLIRQLQSFGGVLAQLDQGEMCDVGGVDLRELGDLVDGRSMRSPAYEISGSDMRFLVSTALPGLLLSNTACQRLNRSDCLKCLETGTGVPVRLPGLNGDMAEETACRVRLGGAGRAALALVARGRFLSPCYELARSRRQRVSLPTAAAPNARPGCLAEACLQNLQRDPSVTNRRCGYTGLDSEFACDDHFAPVSAYIELGGPRPDPMQIGVPDDTIEALVVPDSARVLQAANADLGNVSAQIDGILGVDVLSRMVTTLDYPQSRMALSCRCGGDKVCRAYRGVTYYDADVCAPDDHLIIPAGYSRTACRP